MAGDDSTSPAASQPTTDAASNPVMAGSEPPRGPLARFTRHTEQGQESTENPAVPPQSAVPAEASAPQASPASSDAPAKAPPAAAGQIPRGFRPRGPGDRPKSRREKERDEDKQLDRELAAERGGRGDGAPPHVPVPNRRQ